MSRLCCFFSIQQKEWGSAHLLPDPSTLALMPHAKLSHPFYYLIFRRILILNEQNQII